LLRAHTAGVFDGDMTIFSAERDDSGRSSSLRQMWQPYVGGEIIAHSTGCAHHKMLATEWVSTYGEQLKRSFY